MRLEERIDHHPVHPHSTRSARQQLKQFQPNEMTNSTSNTTHYPDVVWENYKDLPGDLNLSDSLIDSVARDVLRFRGDELDEEERDRIKNHIEREEPPKAVGNNNE